jgi:hypothetical protein
VERVVPGRCHRLGGQADPRSTPAFETLALNEVVHFGRRQYTAVMIAGAHLLLYSKDPQADRAFLTTMQEYQPAFAGINRRERRRDRSLPNH